MQRKLMLLTILAVSLILISSSASAPMQIYCAWHCYSGACSWVSVPNITTSDTDNHWLIDRGNGRIGPEAVVLA